MGFGRYGSNMSLTHSGPAPGPPPPCGVANVLCKLICNISTPIFLKLTTPSIAFKFAPSQYTRPPLECIISAISFKFSSKNPRVLGFVIMIPATFSSIIFSIDEASIIPFSFDFTLMGVNPQMAALAGFVPCAESGMIIFVFFKPFILLNL